MMMFFGSLLSPAAVCERLAKPALRRVALAVKQWLDWPFSRAISSVG
jgi:hypothetical protein